MMRSAAPFASADEARSRLRAASYIADHGLAVAVFLAGRMARPLLLEGEPGVGKTEVAKAVARALDRRLVRLQCYEGIDRAQALYEWDHARQLLMARTADDVRGTALYTEDFLLERPLLEALRAGDEAVLLIDELDRAEDEFEAFLLELLSELAVTVPELGRIAAASAPFVVITSNRTRELHDALVRRCLYHCIDFPDLDREVEVIRLRVPDVSERLARSVADAVARLRALELVKAPGASEAVDWAAALALLGVEELDGRREVWRETLGWVIKNHDDRARVLAALSGLADG